MDHSGDGRTAILLTVRVEHPGPAGGIVQEVIIIDLIPDDASILHMEGQVHPNPGIPAIVREHIHRIDVDLPYGIPPDYIVFKETRAHIGFEA